MWLFSKDNFLSIVQHHDYPEMLLVRGRFKGDIEALFPDAEIVVGAGNDYLYRALVIKKDVAEVMKKQIMNIDYPNFKDENDPERQVFLMDIWRTMYAAQENIRDI